MTTQISPSIGHGLLMSQGGTGTAPGYDAPDVRRMFDGFATEGILSSGSYAVSQRGAGANLSIDVAASTGDGARIQGDAVSGQSIYRVPAHQAVINESISAAHLTLPRNDLVVLELRDNQHDASGANLAQTRVITGTATAGAAKTDALGVNGTPTLPASAIPLAIVNVTAAAASVTNANIDDRRPRMASLLGPGAPIFRDGSGGKSIIPGSETTSGAAAGTWVYAPTPDRVQNVVLPTDGLIFVAFQGTWTMASNASSNVALAAIFVGANQLKGVQADTAGPVVQQTSLAAPGTPPSNVAALHTFVGGLYSALPPGGGYTGDVATGQLVGSYDPAGPSSRAGHAAIFAAAGTYDIGVKFSKASGSAQPTISGRKLWVWTLGFG